MEKEEDEEQEEQEKQEKEQEQEQEKQEKKVEEGGGEKEEECVFTLYVHSLRLFTKLSICQVSY